jgi:hypothetical protein
VALRDRRLLVRVSRRRASGLACDGEAHSFSCACPETAPYPWTLSSKLLPDCGFRVDTVGAGVVTVWVVRAGEELRFLPWFDSEDVADIGWSELPKSPLGMSRQELASEIRAASSTWTRRLSPSTSSATSLGHLWKLSPARLEEFCALYLRALGCEDVKVVGAATAGSLGTVSRPGPPAIRLAVQAKRTAAGVGPHVVT